jgi:predicted transcriptional regulator
MQLRCIIYVASKRGGGKMSNETFKELDDLISRSGLKLNFIAEELGVSRQRLYEIRVKPNTMGIDQMEKMAYLLNVDFMDIYKIYKNFKQKVSNNAT